jgi:hypothetical protein
MDQMASRNGCVWPHASLNGFEKQQHGSLKTITVFSNVSLTVFMPKALKFSLMARLMLLAWEGLSRQHRENQHFNFYIATI